jgi:hypothetical protein
MEWYTYRPLPVKGTAPPLVRLAQATRHTPAGNAQATRKALRMLTSRMEAAVYLHQAVGQRRSSRWSRQLGGEVIEGFRVSVGALFDLPHEPARPGLPAATRSR